MYRVLDGESDKIIARWRSRAENPIFGAKRAKFSQILVLGVFLGANCKSDIRFVIYAQKYPQSQNLRKFGAPHRKSEFWQEPSLGRLP